MQVETGAWGGRGRGGGGAGGGLKAGTRQSARRQGTSGGGGAGGGGSWPQGNLGVSGFSSTFATNSLPLGARSSKYRCLFMYLFPGACEFVGLQTAFNGLSRALLAQRLAEAPPQTRPNPPPPAFCLCPPGAERLPRHMHLVGRRGLWAGAHPPCFYLRRRAEKKRIITPVHLGWRAVQTRIDVRQ
jgi:hypothetical protein